MTRIKLLTAIAAITLCAGAAAHAQSFMSPDTTAKVSRMTK